MTSNDEQVAKLRQRAEAIARKEATQLAENRAALSPQATQQMLHEMRVRQIELELQNEELLWTQGELDSARARYFDLYDQAPVGYCTLSAQGLILESNLTAATLLGVARDALVQQPITRFIRAEDQSIYHLQRKQLAAAGASQTCELRMVKSDGTAFWGHLVMVAAQSANGAPVLRVILSDISERKRTEEVLRESEERFRSFFEKNSSVMLLVEPSSGKLIDANRAAAIYYGYPREQLLAMSISDINTMPPERIAEERLRALKEERNYFLFQHRLASGEVRQVEVYSTPIKSGGIPLLFSIVHDISWRTEALEEH